MTEESTPERRSLTDRRKEEYDALDKKIDQKFDVLTSRLSGFIAKALAGFVIIGITSTIALIGFALVLDHEGNNTDAIQQQRKDSIERSCNDQNKRHDDTINAFDTVADAAVKTNPSRAKEIRASVKANLLIINAVVPKQNCDLLVTSSVPSK